MPPGRTCSGPGCRHPPAARAGRTGAPLSVTFTVSRPPARPSRRWPHRGRRRRSRGRMRRAPAGVGGGGQRTQDHRGQGGEQGRAYETARPRRAASSGGPSPEERAGRPPAVGPATPLEPAGNREVAPARSRRPWATRPRRRPRAWPGSAASGCALCAAASGPRLRRRPPGSAAATASGAASPSPRPPAAAGAAVAGAARRARGGCRAAGAAGPPERRLDGGVAPVLLRRRGRSARASSSCCARPGWAAARSCRARRCPRPGAAAALAALGVGHLAPAEHDRDLDLVLVLEEALDVALLGLVVVLGDLRAQLDLADRHLLLVLARGLAPSAPARTCTSSSRGRGTPAAAPRRPPRPGRGRAPGRTQRLVALETTPICSPSSPISRTSGTRMRSLMRVVSRSGGRRSNLRGIGTS